MEVETVNQRRHPSGITRAASHAALPSYTALKPCALTAKSVVNHKASIDPLLTIGEGSMNPDNLRNKQTNKGDKKRTCSKLNDDKASRTSHIDRSLAHARKSRIVDEAAVTRGWNEAQQQKKNEKLRRKTQSLPKKKCDSDSQKWESGSSLRVAGEAKVWKCYQSVHMIKNTLSDNES